MGREVAEYRWSGYVLATLLQYLEEKHQIDLMKSEYDELAAFLTNTTGATHFIFTPSQRTAFLNRLEPKSFSEEEVRQYFNEFNATNEQEIGRAMLDGVNALHESLGQIEDSSVVVFSITRIATCHNCCYQGHCAQISRGGNCTRRSPATFLGALFRQLTRCSRSFRTDAI
jgi:hypothetical protein